MTTQQWIPYLYLIHTPADDELVELQLTKTPLSDYYGQPIASLEQAFADFDFGCNPQARITHIRTTCLGLAVGEFEHLDAGGVFDDLSPDEYKALVETYDQKVKASFGIG